MERNDWITLVAVHSDSWLISVAFYNGARLDAEGRRQLFNDINSLPTCYEIVSGRARSNHNGGETAKVSKRTVVPVAGGNIKRPRPDKPKDSVRAALEEEEVDGNDAAGASGSEPCPNCGREYIAGEFWIACDFCDRWFDGRCVNMTAQKAGMSSQWRCPFCINARVESIV